MYRFCFLLAVFLLTAIATGSNTDQVSRQEVVKEQECELSEDGTCLLNSDGKNSTEDLVDPSLYVGIELPEMNGKLIDVGHGLPQNVYADSSSQEATRKVLKRMLYYFEKTDLPGDIREACQNRHHDCAFWAATGECTKNPAYMLLSCAAACHTCDQLDYSVRCPLPENYESMNAWKKPGDLDATFERIVKEYESQVTVLASPATSTEETGDLPWVLQLDDFLTDEECDTLIKWGGDLGYERSTDVGEKKFDGTYASKRDSGRTSKNTWCRDGCVEDPITQGVLRKVEQLTGIPDAHSEYLQLLKYEVSQRYNQHHDFIEYPDTVRPDGPRLLTVFMYLNDVEEGGHTRFNKLGIDCQPKKGRIVIWPSVKNEAPEEKDPRTDHEAMPVLKGRKYGANAWVHMRDFKTPHKKSCT